MITPSDHISQDLSYFSGPSTSGAAKTKQNNYIGNRNEFNIPSLRCNTSEFGKENFQCRKTVIIMFNRKVDGNDAKLFVCGKGTEHSRKI